MNRKIAALILVDHGRFLGMDLTDRAATIARRAGVDCLYFAASTLRIAHYASLVDTLVVLDARTLVEPGAVRDAVRAGGTGILDLTSEGAIKGRFSRRIDTLLDIPEIEKAYLSHTSGGGGEGFFTRHMLEMNWVAAGEFQEIGESSDGLPALTTQAVLSRFPITDATAIRFANQALLRWKLSPVQPRRGARIALKARTAGVQMYNAHIESGGNEPLRMRQIRQILDDYTRSRAEASQALIAGDFNNIPAGRSPMFPALAAGGFHNALERTVPTRTSAGNRHPIDWIFVRGLTAEGQVVDTGDASDHLAVVADIRAAAPRPDAHELFLRTETTQTP